VARGDVRRNLLRDHLRHHELSGEYEQCLYSNAAMPLQNQIVNNLRTSGRALCLNLDINQIFTEENRINTDVRRMPTDAGIYAIRSGTRVYVGLAGDIRVRFHRQDFGHYSSNNNTTSRHVVNEDHDVFLLERYSRTEKANENLSRWLSHDEIFWFFTLNGTELEVVNSERNIGRTADHGGYPTIAVNMDSGRHTLHPSMNTAFRTIRIHAGASYQCLIRDSKRQVMADDGEYYSFRFATEAEANLLGTDYTADVLLTVINTNESDCALNQGARGLDRVAELVWNQGTFSQNVVERLRRFRRGRVDPNHPQSNYHGVSWHSRHLCWQVRARNGPRWTDLWQTNCRGLTEIEAAIFREQHVVQRGIEQYNTAGTGYPSNAVLLNEQLPSDQQLPLW